MLPVRDSPDSFKILASSINFSKYNVLSKNWSSSDRMTTSERPTSAFPKLVVTCPSTDIVFGTYSSTAPATVCAFTLRASFAFVVITSVPLTDSASTSLSSPSI